MDQGAVSNPPPTALLKEDVLCSFPALCVYSLIYSLFIFFLSDFFFGGGAIFPKKGGKEQNHNNSGIMGAGLSNSLREPTTHT